MQLVLARRLRTFRIGAAARCNVADEMQWIIDRYDPDQVWYADDVFTISHPWLDSIQRRARRPRHPPSFRDHHARRPSAERSRRGNCCALGCYRIWIGSESGSQRILDAMQRGVKVEQVRRACAARSCARHPGRHVPHVGL